MNALNNVANAQAVGASFVKVESAAPLKDGFLSIVLDNQDPYITNKKQSEKDTQDGLTALYVRLSNDDKIEGESNSIATQKKILERYCKEKGYTGLRYYDEDDGYSGTNFDRPGFVL